MSDAPGPPPATDPPPADRPPAAARPPVSVPPAPDRVKPAAITASAATLALAGGIAAVALTSKSGAGAAAAGEESPTGSGPTGSGPTGSGSGSGTPTPTTGPPSTGSTTSTAPAASTSASASPSGSATTSPGGLSGSWTGSVEAGGDQVGARITLDGDPSAVTGQLLFADPDSSAWVAAGALTGALAGTDLRLQSDTQVLLTLTSDGDKLAGTGTLTSKDHPFQITVSLTRD